MIIGAQLYTLRAFTQTARDLDEALRRVADIGYTAVQISAVGPIAPEKIREACDKYDLKIALTHSPEARILCDTEALIREHDVLGADYIGLGAMSERYRQANWIDRFALDFETPAKKIRDAGKKLMYHNHAFEFETLSDGRKIIDVITAALPADIMGITLDTYWLQFAGCDVCAWIDKLADRLPCVHLKDMTVKGFAQRMAAVGEGNMNFKAILRKFEELGGTKFALVEQDDCYGEDPFMCMKQSFDNIKAIRG